MKNATPSLTTDISKLWQAGYDKYSIAKFVMPEDVNSLIDLLKPSMDKNSADIALVMGEINLTYAQLDHASRQFADFLQRQGYKKGTRIAVQLPNILQYPVVIMGCLRAGLVLVNVNPLYTSYELTHQIDDSGAEVLVIFDVMSQAYDNLEESVKCKLKQVVVCSMDNIEGVGSDISLMMSPNMHDTLANEVILNKESINNENSQSVRFANILASNKADDFTPIDIELDDLAVLQYTGGTTGKAKGAMLTQSALISNVIQCHTMFGDSIQQTYQEQIKILNPLPLYHIFSFTVCGLLSIYSGWQDILITNPRDMNGLIDSFDKHKPHIMPSVNTLFAGMLKHPKFASLDFSNLHLAIGGGTAIIAEISKQWQAVTGIIINEGYGMSETSPVICFNPLGVTEFNGSVGLPLPSTFIKILDDDNNICDIGQAGEVCIKGLQVMQGYWQMDNSNTFTDDGYFRSGDIGFIGEDGNITLIDRKKDMILVSGFNVYPNEIESVLTEHPKVFEVGVIGVADEKSSEAPKAFVVKSDDSLTEQELSDFAKERMTGYKRPHAYVFIDELPKSAVGKILRKDLRTFNS